MMNLPLTQLPIHGIFRSVDEWKSALMILPDSNFFELVRSVFGNIKTPFSKQRLLDDLMVFLSKKEIRTAISAYINDQDHKIIAALALLGEPTPSCMESFFEGEFNCAEIRSMLVNLEERLIIYRFRNNGVLCLALNPVLEPVLVPFITDTRPLFPVFPMESRPFKEGRHANGRNRHDPKKGKPFAEGELSNKGADCIMDNRIMAALFSFALGGEDLLKAEGGVRKKILDDGRCLFPELDLDLVFKTILLLGLFRRGSPDGTPLPPHPEYWGDPPEESSPGACFLPCMERIAGFGKLSPSDRQEYWAAGVFLSMNNSGQNINYRSRLRKIASFIHRFRCQIDPGKLYPEITLKRIIGLLGKNEGNTPDPLDPEDFASLPAESFLAVMEMSGLMEKKGPFRAGSHVPAREIEAGAANPVIAMDTAFSFILYPEIAFADAMDLALFCSVKGIPRPIRQNREIQNMGASAFCFELTRASVIRGFDHGVGADSMTELLDRLSHNRIETSLRWTLREWEGRYAGVSLHHGTVLALSEDRRYLAEAEPVASMVHKVIAPGVYLLSSEERAGAARALRKAGVDIIAQPAVLSSVNETASSFFRPIPSGAAESFPVLFVPFTENAASDEVSLSRESAPSYEGAAIQEKFRGILEKMRLSKHERDELSARINRRLVLSEAQLEGASLRYEKLEAQGLDYAGKSVIAKHAMQSGSLIEITLPGMDGDYSRLTGTVEALEKKDGEGILVLKPLTAAGEDDVNVQGNTIRIPLGKISLLRRIKQSIFGE